MVKIYCSLDCRPWTIKRSNFRLGLNCSINWADTMGYNGRNQITDKVGMPIGLVEIPFIKRM